MNKLFLRLLTIALIFMVTCQVLAGYDKPSNSSPLPETAKMPETTANNKNWVMIRCGNAVALNFRGMPNETQVGDLTFTVNTNLRYKSIVVEIVGGAFENDHSSLETEYQPSNERIWYKAGDAFQVTVVPEAINCIRFRATTGTKISTQYAGNYTAKLSFSVISYLQ